MGFVNSSCIYDPLVIDTLQAYLPSMLHQADEVLEGAFHFIVDTGCSLSASPFKADFESLQTLQKPVTLHGIAGNSTVTQSGTLCFQCINTKREVVTIKTFGYHNPSAMNMLTTALNTAYTTHATLATPTSFQTELTP